MIVNNLTKEYKEIPVNCQICKFFLEDDYFIEEFGTKFVCTSNDEIDPVFSGHNCGDFKIGEWELVGFLERTLGDRQK